MSKQQKKNIGAYQLRTGVSTPLKTAAETQQFGRAAAIQLQHGLWLLSGPLGSGKTTFVRSMLKALGVRGAVTSPTFTLARTYAPKRRWKHVLHVDAYRLHRQSEIAATGLVEAIEDKNTLVLVEWPERIRIRWPKPRIRLRFSYAGTGRRVTLHLSRSGRAQRQRRG